MLSLLRSSSSTAYLRPRWTVYRTYAQQRTARTARSLPQQTTSKPSPSAQGKGSPNKPAFDVKSAHKVYQKQKFEEDMKGAESLIPAMMMNQGVDMWAQKFPLLDVRIPKKPREVAISDPSSLWQTLRENARNRWQNILSMYRMGSEFAFPGILTKRVWSPQLFMAQSTKDTAWIAPVRKELLDVYKRTNEAIANGDERLLKRITAYEFQSRVVALVRKRSQNPGITYTWKCHSEITPCRVVSLRAVPGHHGAVDPSIGNRLVAHLVARFETLQSLEMRNRRGQLLRPDGTVASPEDPLPEPRRVLEYMVFENKMWYTDGWIIRDQMYEGIEGKYKEID